MHTRFFTMTALALSLGLAPALPAEEPPQPPPPPQGEATPPPPPPGENDRARDEGRRFMQRGRMSEEQRAKFAELSAKVDTALAKYRESQKEEDLTALKQTVSERFVALQEFLISQAEQAITRAKERIEKKDTAVEREVNRLLRPERRERGPRPDRPERPGRRGPEAMNFNADEFAPLGKPERKSDEKRQAPKPERPRFFTEAEQQKIREQEKILLDVKPDSPEAAAAVKEIGAVYESALVRIKAECDATEDKKERSRLERAQKMVERMLERTKDPVKYAKSVKERSERAQKAKDKKDPREPGEKRERK